MEQHRNASAGETGDSRGNPPTSDIVRHDSHMRKSGGDPARGLNTGFALVGSEQANRSATAAPLMWKDCVSAVSKKITEKLKLFRNFLFTISIMFSNDGLCCLPRPKKKKKQGETILTLLEEENMYSSDSACKWVGYPPSPPSTLYEMSRRRPARTTWPAHVCDRLTTSGVRDTPTRPPPFRHPSAITPSPLPQPPCSTTPRTGLNPRPGSPDFRKWQSCRTVLLVGGFSRGPPVSPTRSFRRLSIFTSITLIAVKSRPNLFTPPPPPFSTTNRHDGNTARLARRSDEALGVRVTVARIAPSLLDLGDAQLHSRLNIGELIVWMRRSNIMKVELERGIRNFESNHEWTIRCQLAFRHLASQRGHFAGACGWSSRSMPRRSAYLTLRYTGKIGYGCVGDTAAGRSPSQRRCYETQWSMNEGVGGGLCFRRVAHVCKWSTQVAMCGTHTQRACEEKHGGGEGGTSSPIPPLWFTSWASSVRCPAGRRRQRWLNQVCQVRRLPPPEHRLTRLREETGGPIMIRNVHISKKTTELTIQNVFVCPHFSISGRITGFSQVGIVPDVAVGRWVFSGISPPLHPFIPALLRIYFYHPHQLTRQISSVTHTRTKYTAPRTPTRQLAAQRIENILPNAIANQTQGKFPKPCPAGYIHIKGTATPTISSPYAPAGNRSRFT
ncbi:hypothetical protein PR048_014290 [Dryococelus australis]|uniref:Uncharacterized protein n=1 Tax=Dryococelus australis TaxID=614101 RepID=A0ABQ9HDW6_9NEOP|nr:hypothetical protein PR048_014290 [Dryococelus australis]